MDLSTAAASASGALEQLRLSLQERFGATHLQIDVAVEGDVLRLRGTVLVPSLRAAAAKAVQSATEGAWRIDTSQIGIVIDAPWLEVQSVAELFDRAPSMPGPANLCTELDRGSPIQRLGELGGATLVRGVDGTVGWIAAALKECAEPPRLVEPRQARPSQLVAAAAEFTDAPYRLGGTTAQAIDCSGLVQRAIASTLGVVVPRHTKDQAGICPRGGPPPPGPGHLIFVWTVSEALCHVGITDESTVVHASLSRRRVVRDPTPELLEASRRTLHVRFDDVVEFGRRVAGHASLIAAGVELGRPLPTSDSQPADEPTEQAQ